MRVDEAGDRDPPAPVDHLDVSGLDGRADVGDDAFPDQDVPARDLAELGVEGEEAGTLEERAARGPRRAAACVVRVHDAQGAVTAPRPPGPVVRTEWSAEWTNRRRDRDASARLRSVFRMGPDHAPLSAVATVIKRVASLPSPSSGRAASTRSKASRPVRDRACAPSRWRRCTPRSARLRRAGRAARGIDCSGRRRASPCG